MRMRGIIVASVLSFIVGGHVAALSPAPRITADEFGKFDEAYHPIRFCRPHRAIASCEGQTAQLCALVDKTDLFQSDEAKRTYLLDLGWVLHKRGLVTAEADAHSKLNTLGNGSWYADDSLFFYRDLSGVWLEASNEKRAESTCSAMAQAAETPPEDEDSFAFMAYRLVIEGKTESAKHLLERVKALPNRAALGGLTISKRIRYLAMAWAELGDYQTAEQFILHDEERLRGLIAQVALNHGDLDDAIRIAGRQPIMFERDRSVVLAKMGILQGLIDAGRTTESTALVKDWGLIQGKVKSFSPDGSAIYSEVSSIDLDRFKSLAEGSRDPVLAYHGLRESDANVCRARIALIGARSGKPDGAMTVLLEGRNTSPPDFRTRDEIDLEVVNATLSIARAYADAGQANKGHELLDREWQRFWSSSLPLPPPDPENVYSKSVWSIPERLIQAYGEIGEPEFAEIRINGLQETLPFPAVSQRTVILRRALSKAAHSLVERDQLNKALDVVARLDLDANQAAWYAGIVSALVLDTPRSRPFYGEFSLGCPIEITKQGEFAQPPQ